MRTGDVGNSGEGRGWSSHIELSKIRRRYPKLGAKPFAVHAFGITMLHLGNLAHTSCAPARATVALRENRTVSFQVGEHGSRLGFMVRQTSNTDFMLGFQGKAFPSEDLKYDKPFIIGAKSRDLPTLRGFYPADFPAFAAAVTLRDDASLLVESLDSTGRTGVQLYYGLYLQPDAFSSTHVNRMIAMNKKLLEWAVSSGACFRYSSTLKSPGIGPSFYTFPEYFIVTMSPTGRLLTCNERTDQDHFTFWIRLNVNMSMQYSSMSRDLESTVMAPAIIKRMLLWSLSAYNNSLKGRSGHKSN